MIELKNVKKIYGEGAVSVIALGGVTLTIPDQQFCSIIGPSGSGKSTMLHLLGGLDYPTEGEVLIDGKNTATMSDNELTLLRRRRIGFIFQFFNLLPTLTAIENVALPAMLDLKPAKEVMSRALELLDLVGLKKRATHTPDELSGGEMQRVAIARALILDPPIILADEPTGNLDSASSAEVLKFLRNCVDGFCKTVVLVTHDREAAAVADRQLTIRDGKIEADSGK